MNVVELRNIKDKWFTCTLYGVKYSIINSNGEYKIYEYKNRNRFLTNWTYIGLEDALLNKSSERFRFVCFEKKTNLGGWN